MKKRTIYLCTISLLGLILGNANYFSSVAANEVVSATPNNIFMLSPEADTFIASNRSTENFLNNQALWVGNRDFNGFGDQRVLLKFQIPSEITATTTITSATLHLYAAAWRTGDAPLNVQVERITTDWPNDIAWQGLGDLRSDSDVVQSKLVPIGEGLYEWDVNEMLSNWIRDPSKSQSFGLLVKAVPDETNRFRGFWSQECEESLCNGNQPRLQIEYFNPPPPIPTPSPTPGIQSIHLYNQPTGDIAPGELITYTIDIRNGGHALSNVRVENPLPEGVELAPLPTVENWSAKTDNNVITWHLTPTMAISATAQLHYVVQRHTPTPVETTGTGELPDTATPTLSPTVTFTPPPTSSPDVNATPTAASSTNLVISKSAPEKVKTGESITYTLTITNLSAQPIGNLVIWDLIPNGTDNVVYKDPGAELSLSTRTIKWPGLSLNAGEPITKQFAIQPAVGLTQVVNDLYLVDIIENEVVQERIVGQKIVITAIESIVNSLYAAHTLTGTTDPPYLPIVNAGAIIFWEYPEDTEFSDQLPSGGTRNPPYYIILPAIWKDGAPPPP